jgi:hypothetical protein
MFYADLRFVLLLVARPEDWRLREGSGQRRSSSDKVLRPGEHGFLSPSLRTERGRWRISLRLYQGLRLMVLPACGLLGQPSHHLPTGASNNVFEILIQEEKLQLCICEMQEIEPSRDEVG